ncbi:MAG: hypothetical protein LBM19_02550 [Holosporales bacterium]|jgi:hypothetical protein|nr:hypothetical protein [Holosporales bacterium]
MNTNDDKPSILKSPTKEEEDKEPNEQGIKELKEKITKRNIIDDYNFKKRIRVTSSIILCILIIVFGIALAAAFIMSFYYFLFDIDTRTKTIKYILKCLPEIIVIFVALCKGKFSK